VVSVVVGRWAVVERPNYHDRTVSSTHWGVPMVHPCSTQFYKSRRDQELIDG
jgi:hypothetical protein